MNREVRTSVKSKKTMSFEENADKVYQDMWKDRKGEIEKSIPYKVIDTVQWLLISVCIVASMMLLLAEIGGKAEPKIMLGMACCMLVCSFMMLVLNKIQLWRGHYHENHMKAIDDMMEQLFEGYKGRLLPEKIICIDAFASAYSKGRKYRCTKVKQWITWVFIQISTIIIGIYFNFLNIVSLGLKGLIVCLLISFMLWGAAQLFAPEIRARNTFFYDVMVTYRRWLLEKEVLQNNAVCLEEKETDE